MSLLIPAHDPALAEKSATPWKHGPRRIALIAAAVAACLLVTTAFSAKVTGLDRLLLEFLGTGEQEQAKVLIAGAQVVDKTARSAGSSLTVREVLGDRNNLYILLNFTAPKGTALDAYDYRFSGGGSHLTFDARDGWHFSDYIKLEDADSGDNCLDLVLRVTTDGISTGGTMTMELTDLEAAAGYGEPYVPLGLPGTWKVSFPLSVMVKGGGENLQEAVDAARASGEEGFFPVTIRFRDGTCLTTSGEAGDNYSTIVSGMGRYFYTSWTFHKVNDLEQVESIEFFGVSIPAGRATRPRFPLCLYLPLAWYAFPANVMPVGKAIPFPLAFILQSVQRQRIRSSIWMTRQV